MKFYNKCAHTSKLTENMGIFISPEQKQRNAQLEQRCRTFALDLMMFVRKQNGNICTNVVFNQVIRSASSIGANYIEANEATTKKEFVYRVEIVKKEAKETVYWLDLYKDFVGRSADVDRLRDEANQIFKIFCKILHNTKSPG